MRHFETNLSLVIDNKISKLVYKGIWWVKAYYRVATHSGNFFNLEWELVNLISIFYSKKLVLFIKCSFRKYLTLRLPFKVIKNPWKFLVIWEGFLTQRVAILFLTYKTIAIILNINNVFTTSYSLKIKCITFFMVLWFNKEKKKDKWQG